MEVRRCPITHPQLLPWLTNIWVLRGTPDTAIHHKLLPTSTIDMLINLSAPMSYQQEAGPLAQPQRLHLSGPRTTFAWIEQQGPIHVIGLSLPLTAAAVFLKTPLFELTNQMINLSDIHPHLANRLAAVLDPSLPDHSQLQHIQQVLFPHIISHTIPREITARIHDCLTSELSLEAFCQNRQLHPRKLEREFRQYNGFSPKFARRLHRFQHILPHILNASPHSLTWLSQEYGYYDQTHFLKDFRLFTGSSPRHFIKNPQTVRQLFI